ncbi:uncharacterized protein [Physcomitrium patens]|uniref:uncharacterized protein isoform X2 n=1 Tax=Physcomitrium patens TaxID=3218 RepID=UPI003CCDB1DA
MRVKESLQSENLLILSWTILSKASTSFAKSSLNSNIQPARHFAEYGAHGNCRLQG